MAFVKVLVTSLVILGLLLCTVSASRGRLNTRSGRFRGSSSSRRYRSRGQSSRSMHGAFPDGSLDVVSGAHLGTRTTNSQSPLGVGANREDVESHNPAEREASYLTSYKRWHYYKVPVSGAMTSTNVKTTCEAAGYVTPCPGDSDCRYSSSSCVFTGLEDCIHPMKELSQVLCSISSSPETCDQLDGVYQFMNWRNDNSCGMESGDWCVFGSERQDRYALCARDGDVKGAAPDDTTSVPQDTTKRPLKAPSNCCGNILRQATEVVDQSTDERVPDGWTLCYIDGRDTDHLTTRCRDLLQGIPQYGNAQQLLAAGGNFGCWHGNTGNSPGPAYASNDVIQKSCRKDIQHSTRLASWISSRQNTTLGVCIKGITCEMSATTVAPIGTTTASHETTVASDRELKREASYLAAYKGWHYYKVPVSGAMTSANVKTTCEAAGYVTPCPGDSDCRYSSSSCVSTGLEDCSGPMNDISKALCGAKSPPNMCSQLYGVYQFMSSWRSNDDACGAESGSWCVSDASGRMDRYAFCARDINLTTVATPAATTSPPRTQVSRNCCGNILRQATELVDQTTDHKVPEGWTMCYIDERDTDHLYTPCRDLLQGIPQYGNADQLLAAGGNFGCWHGYTGLSPGPAYTSNNVIQESCRDGIQHSNKLSAWAPEPATFGVCIRGITCETNATTVAPMETTTASHDTTVTSEQESKREASYLASYKGWHYYKVPVSGAMTSTNVKTTCEAAGYVTPCPGDRDCRYSSSSCVSTGLEDCSHPMNDVSHVLCGSNSTPHTCGQLDGVYQYMNNWKSGDASCGVESGRWCVKGSEQEDRYAFCARDKNVTAVTTLRTTTTSHDTTVATPEVTTSPPRTKVSRNCCGNILRQATELVDQSTDYRVPDGWTLCYIDGRDTVHHSTRCRDLLQGIPEYGNARSLLAAGGNFGCWHGNTGNSPGPAYASNNVIQKSCRKDIQHSTRLASWSRNNTLGVCIKGITCDRKATAVAPMETTTTFHETTVASDKELRNCCGNIMRQATELVDQSTDYKVPEGWTLCYVDGRDTNHYGTRCRELLKGIPRYGNAEQLLAAGGNFGCWHGNTGDPPGPAYASNDVIEKSCRDDIQHSSKLSGWTPETSTFGVCIRGITCDPQPPDKISASITCTNDYMELAIPEDELTGIDQNNLHWEPDQNCGATTNGTHYLFRTDLYGCGTKATFDPKYVVFKNTINIGSVHEANSVISREGDIRITSKCKYERQQWVDSTFQPIPGLHGLNITEEGFGELEVRLSMFPTRQYQTPYFADQYPIHLRPRQRTYLQLEARGHGKTLSVLALNCKATMSPKPNDPLQYQLIKDGCASDPTLDIYREDLEDPTKERFGFEAFRFIQEVKMVYVHCEVMVCDAADPGSRCAQGCVAARRKRTTADKVDMVGRHMIHLGPIILDDDEAASSSLRSRRGAPWALLAAGGGLMALALVVLGAAVVRKHSRREEWAYQAVTDVEGEE